VIARYDDGDRLYAVGYRGEGAELVELLVCLDAETGTLRWERAYADFLSDIIYNRYSIGAPGVDAETGNVYLLTSPGLLVCLDRDGGEVWRRSLLEEFGRLTFPNGRTGCPALDGDLVIVNAITSNWGREGPARNRFYAFDKRTGDLVWSSTPGVGPPYLKDSSFATPLFATVGRHRVFYAGTGCGNVVCVDARTGRPVWRYQLSVGGINSAVVPYRDTVIAIHGKENVDDSGRGRMVALRPGEVAPPAVLGAEHEVWRNNDVSMFTSSPVIAGDRVYQITLTGDLHAIDARTGAGLWHEKLGPDQLHASPLYADGKLYIALWNGTFHVIRPTDEGPKILSTVELEGSGIGSPSVFNGKIYVHTTQKLYCFGKRGARNVVAAAPWAEPAGPGGAAVSLQVVPAEVALRPGEKQTLAVRALDAAGLVRNVVAGAAWEPWVPPAAKVTAELDASVNEKGELVAPAAARLSAGAFKATAGGVSGFVRGRILPAPPVAEDFEGFALDETDEAGGARYAHPPLPWIGARLKWRIVERDGTKVLAKTLDRVLFQRSMVFLGHHDERNYTIAADVMSDGNRRGMSTVGVINQRYIIALDGNWQQLVAVSNHDRFKVGVPFAWKPRTWYRVKARVDVGPDGAGVLRAKAWPRGEPEPEKWLLEAPHARAHRQGAPGLYGFSPQSIFSVYIDNVHVVPNS
jgi:outer membrane protein assembly factor BamB